MDKNYNNKSKIQKLITIFTTKDGLKSHVKNNKGFYIFIASLLCFRSFVYSYNTIPSGSMMPTLMPNDQVLVDKTAYNVKIPLINKTIFKISSPEVGDVITFNQEKQGDTIYMVKRVIAKGGDKIYFNNNKAYVNGETLKYNLLDSINEKDKLLMSNYEYSETDSFKSCLQDYENKEDGLKNCNEQFSDSYTFYEQTDYNGNSYNIGLKSLKGMNPKIVKHLEMKSKVITVPEGKLFVMGDYRNGSFDSRFFGFVDEEDVVGKVTKVAFNYSDLKYDVFGDRRYWKDVK
tara:strand:+ start:15168 stop:16034 length:867 start_codon:yes stop_codon:yes gene_type:complete